jgi:protein-L-isoaspartate(D-aspartate) O-methyltransferase
MDEFEAKRARMVESQIECRGVKDAQTLRVMRKVPRHAFIPPEYRHLAYTDSPLPIGRGQTISQPYIVAFMTEAVHPAKGKKALEIGTGSGYQAAVLAEIVDSVYTIEIIEELAGMASTTLKELGYTNVVVKLGDGYKGWPQHAPFDIIIVTAACNHIPQPLLDQLAENGRMIIPVGERDTVQELVLITRKKGEFKKKIMLPVRFVPFTRDEDD